MGKKDGWVSVKADDGRIYYYHAVTRQVRWNKPEGVLLEKMEARIASQEAERARRQQERLERLHREEEEKRQRSEEGATVQKEIEGHVRNWVTNARAAKVSSFCPGISHNVLFHLLSGLQGVLKVCGTALRIPANAIPQQTAETEAGVLKKSYLKALRVVHPDKVAADAPVRTRVTSKLVFSALNEAFARFKAAA